MSAKLYQVGFAVATTMTLLLLSQLGQRLTAAGAVADAAKGNAGRALLQVGRVLGVFLIAAAIVSGCVAGESWQHDAMWVAAFGGASLVLFEVTGALGVRLLLRAKLPAEVARGNAAAGLAAGAHYVATSIIIAKNITGTDLNALAIALVFFVIAQVTLHAFVALFRALTVYDDSEEILNENLAAALSYAGLTLGVAILVGNASEGQFSGWGVSLKGYALALLVNLVFYPVRQFVVQTVLLGSRPTLRGGRLDEAIGQERNVGLGAIEAVAYVATALLVTRVG